MKRYRKGVLTGAIFIFAGLVSIPLAYKLASLINSTPVSVFLTAMVPAVLIGGGLLQMYVTNMLHNPGVDHTNTNIYTNAATTNDKPGTVPDGMVNVPKQIVIDINDNGISLRTSGMSSEQIITYLEMSKYYVITKSVSLIDIVKRE